MPKSAFDHLTRQYALSKTLRFELKPIGNTRKMLVENDVFIEDEIRKEKYEKAKIYFDRLHREFAQESLRDISLENLNGYFGAFQKWQQDRKDKDALDALQKKEKHCVRLSARDLPNAPIRFLLL